MRCLNPRKVGFQSDGKTLAWSYKRCDKEYAIFAIPCGKCLECRLEYARTWAVRCIHEAKMHKENSFITLTYSNENLPRNGRLDYKHFQDFMKRLRDSIYRVCSTKEEYESKRIGYFVTGEYGERTKRPHWHAILFNWRPSDLVEKYTSDRGDKVYSSSTLTEHWGNGIAEVGSVTFESAGYVARYAAKKLVHGQDEVHDFHPISKKSSKKAIGKSWLERYWRDAFDNGQIVLPNGTTCAIPRYYEKWLAKEKPEEFLRYIEKLKVARAAEYQRRADLAEEELKVLNNWRLDHGKGLIVDKSVVKTKIIEAKFAQLQKHLKGDI